MVNFAAESHLDRFIHSSGDCIETNIVGTFRLLEAVRAYWNHLPAGAVSDSDGSSITSLSQSETAPTQESFRFLHVSPDDVYGSLAKGDPAFSETHRYEPNSPYSVSKAARDHLMRAWHHTYDLPVLTTNCSNNY